MNVRPTKKPLLVEEDEIPTASRQSDMGWFEKSLEKSPKDLGLRFGKARLHMQRDEWEDAKKDLMIIIESDSDQGQAWDLLLVAAKMIGDNPTLLLCYVNLVRLRKWDETIMTEHGKTLLRMGRYSEAKEKFDDVLEIDDGNADAWAGRSEAIRQMETMEDLPHDEINELDDSKKMDIIEGYDKALEIEPSNIHALQGKTELSLREKEWDKASQYADHAIGVSPSCAVSWEQKARALEMQGDNERAMMAYQKAVKCPETKAEGYDPMTLMSRARAMEKVGEEESSIRCLEKIIDIDRENQRALMKKAEILEGMGRHQEAATTLDRLVELRPRDHYLWYLKGNSEKASEQYPKAMMSYDHSIGEKPDFSPAVISKGETLYKMGRLEEGAQVIGDLLNMDPGNVEGLKMRDVIHQAISVEGRKMVSSPNSIPRMASQPTRQTLSGLSPPELISNVRMLMEQGREEDALEMLDNNSIDGDVDSIAMRADLLNMTGQYDDSIFAYQEAIQMEPGRAELYTSSARAHFENDNLQAALRTIQSCPVEEAAPEMMRAEIEIEAEMLSRSIKEKFGVLTKGRGSKKKPVQKRAKVEKKQNKEHLDVLNQKIESIISVNPEDDLLWYARSMLLYEMKDIKGAIKSIEKALWISPENKKYWETKGELFALIGNKAKSEECLDCARELPEKPVEDTVAVAADDYVRSMVQEPSTVQKEAEELSEMPSLSGDTMGELFLSESDLEIPENIESLLEEGGDWGAELIAEWKEPEEDSFKCPDCNSSMVVGEEKCDSCGSIFKWDFSINQSEQFLTDLLFFDCLKEELHRDMLASVVFRFEEGRIITISSKNKEGAHVVREWESE